MDERKIGMRNDNASVMNSFLMQDTIIPSTLRFPE